MILDTVFPRTPLPETRSLIENLFYLWLLLRFWPNFFEELRRKWADYSRRWKTARTIKCHHQKRKLFACPFVENREVTRQHGTAVALRANNNNKLSDFLTIISQIITYALKNVKKTNISWLSFNSLKFISWWFGRENAAWFWDYPRGSCLQSSMAAFQQHLPAGTWPRPCHPCD